MRKISVWCLSIMVIIGCSESAVQLPPAVGDVQFYLFAAPSCEPCNKEIPEVEKRLGEIPHPERFKLTVMVEFGRNFQEKPTDEVTAAWKKVLNSKLEFKNDEWKCKTYRRYLDQTCSLPGAVMLQGERVTRFYAGSCNTDCIISALKEATK